MTDTIEPESFLSEGQRLAMQTAKKCWHQHLADGGDEVTIAIAMMAHPVAGMHKIDIFTAGRVGARLLMKANETLLEIALEDAEDGTLNADADELRVSLEKAVADRITATKPATSIKPTPSRPTLVPAPAND